jgi:RND superfamily putative drug exporter
MRLLGDRAWWSPQPMTRWWHRHLLPDGAEAPVAAPVDLEAARVDALRGPGPAKH